ncbi:TonB-dependent receptor [Saccharobesus litoralis]|uniref:TonB-dependent receptor n=1 Tax=Saccharobesus litoralis TaxID=2172099 RepID=A0A2S0VPC1_9ALTE|nr:TonB-dependent receptor [Saccharobesus litoralis]AWB66071.1 TonB-dependent receptor [Saccharobesus litoralis]
MQKTRITRAILSRKYATKDILVGSAAGLMVALASPTVLAAEEETEVIEVSGVRGSLEQALHVKREATSIVDAISATDMEALPALDLGEALQALPGIQLNSETEGRQSTISLRGLSSGFVKTTAFGQSFATPTAAAGHEVGAPNPFSAFESGIFDGVTVVKSPTADLQEGGVAGVVDMQLQQALSKKDGLFNISVGASYEALPEATNPNIKLSGVKHLIEDKLAVGFKFSHSKQEFRRDTFDIIDYTDADDFIEEKKDADGNITKIVHERSTNVDQYREKWNVPSDAVLRVPQKAKNVTQYSVGDRYSFAGNLEYRISDNFKVGAHLLKSQRVLDDGTKEVTNFESGLHKTNPKNDWFGSEVTLDMDVEPFFYVNTATDGTGADAYIAPAISFTNGHLQHENRKTTFEEKTQGVILYADYAVGDWNFDAQIVSSKASNEFTNIGLGYRARGDNKASNAQTGFNAYINTGGGDLDKIRVERLDDGKLDGVQVYEPYIDYVVDDLAWRDPRIDENLLSVRDPQNQNRNLSTYLNGRTRDLKSTLDSFEFNSQRFLDLSFSDALRFDSIKFGTRYQVEDTESIDKVNGLGGIDASNFGSSYLSNQPLSAHQSAFFNGKIGGTFDHNSGWVTLDNDLAIAAFQNGIETDPTKVLRKNGVEVQPTLTMNRAGFWDRARGNGHGWLVSTNYDVKQELTAFYATTDFAGDLPLDMSYSGNFGVRYVKTENTFDGFELGSNTPYTFKDDYSNTLPMANISLELTEDIILRTAYYEGIVRPNINKQIPSPSFIPAERKIDLELPSATLKPYEADNFDLSLEWYNREGSAISIGYFQKNISNLFKTEKGYCPDDGSDPIVNEFLGDSFHRVGDATNYTCEEIAVTTLPPAEGETEGESFNRDVNIERSINVDEELKVEGFELAIQQNLDFLPYPWNGFGGVFNYTKLRQSGSETLLSRVSPESYNIITYWEDEDISVRFAYNWRDDQTTSGANSFLGTLDRTIAAKGRLDFSSSYKINENMKVYFQAFNLTDEVVTSHYGDDDRAIHQLTYNGRIYKASFNYKF